MHGLKPEDLQHLKPLCGERFIQIAVGEHEIQFATCSKPIDGLSVEGRCELRTTEGQIIDTWDRGKRSREFRFFELLGHEIKNVSIDSDRSFIAIFGHGMVLRVIDDSEQYESFSVGGLVV